jgi:DNA-binding transcriptional regulator YiaG
MTAELESPLMRLRTLRRVTQRELAEALNVSVTTIKNWESGRSIPNLSIGQFKILMKMLDIKSVEELPDSFAPQPIHDTASPSSHI